MAAPRTEFEKQIALEMPAFVGLARRLGDGTLTPEEVEMLKRTATVLELRAQKWKNPHIAEKLGITPAALQGFVGRGTFRTMVRWLKERATNPGDREREARARSERERFEGLGPKALDFLELCFDRDEKGAYRSRLDAKWATQILAKGKGWDEPEAGRRQIDVKIGVIQKQQRAIRASDAAFHGAVVVEAEGKRVMVALPSPDRSVDLEAEGEVIDGEAESCP